jgi:hypothetical protein
VRLVQCHQAGMTDLMEKMASPEAKNQRKRGWF